MVAALPQIYKITATTTTPTYGKISKLLRKTPQNMRAMPQPLEITTLPMSTEGDAQLRQQWSQCMRHFLHHHYLNPNLWYQVNRSTWDP